MFSVWLKGTGNVRLMLQRNGNDYASYKHIDIQVTNDWKKYSIFCEKQNDGNSLRAVLDNFRPTDNVSIWEPELIEIQKK